MTARVELRLAPDDSAVGLARLVVVSAARQAGMDPERLEDLRVVVSEATTNALRSHQHADSPEPVVVTFGVHEEGVFDVTVSDYGPGFDPVADVEPDARDATGEDGLGLTLMRALADHASFEQQGGLHVRLRFSLVAAHA